MATTKGQRIGIWVIAGTMMIGTIGGFVAMMVAPGNQAREQAELQKAQEEYTAALQEYQKKATEQNEQYDAAIDAKVAELGLNEKYAAEFSGYTSRVSAFNKDEVTELKTEDLKVGDGEEIKDDSNVAMYYIGWNPTGEVFDQSIDGDKLNNRPSNLRAASNSQNNCNKGIPSTNSSGIKGVFWNKRRGKWEAKCSLNGRTQYLGCFHDTDQAAAAVRAFREKCHGEFARHT